MLQICINKKQGARNFTWENEVCLPLEELLEVTGKKKQNRHSPEHQTTGPTKVSLELIFLAVKAKWPEAKILKLRITNSGSHGELLTLGKVPKNKLQELGIEVLLKIRAYITA